MSWVAGTSRSQTDANVGSRRSRGPLRVAVDQPVQGRREDAFGVGVAGNLLQDVVAAALDPRTGE